MFVIGSTKEIQNRGHVVYTDNFYTFPLLAKLLAHKSKVFLRSVKSIVGIVQPGLLVAVSIFWHVNFNIMFILEQGYLLKYSEYHLQADHGCSFEASKERTLLRLARTTVFNILV